MEGIGSQIEQATSAFNKTPHGVTEAPPNNMSASVVLEQSKIAAQSAAHNMREIQQRQKKLEKEGGFGHLRGRNEEHMVKTHSSSDELPTPSESHGRGWEYLRDEASSGRSAG